MTALDFVDRVPVGDDRAERAARDLLDSLGVDVDHPDLAPTPARMVAALRELLTPVPFEFTTFENTQGYDELVLARAIPFSSVCEHHVLPFVGIAHVGYVPRDRIVGLSKLARVVDGCARGLQVQERLTVEIADCLDRELDPRGVGVVLEAEHLCMSIRGVRRPGSRTVTSRLTGCLRSDMGARREFLARCSTG
jgi:GTP cyclohydrolase I